MTKTYVIGRNAALATNSTDLIAVTENSKPLTTVIVTVRMTPMIASPTVPAAIAMGSGSFNSVLSLVGAGSSAGTNISRVVEGIILQPGYSLFVRGNPYSVRTEGYEYFHTGGDGYFGSVALRERRTNIGGSQKIFSTPIDKGAELDEFASGNGGTNVTTLEIYIIDLASKVETVLVPARQIPAAIQTTRRIPVPPNCDVYVRSVFAFEAYYQWMFSPIEKRVF